MEFKYFYLFVFLCSFKRTNASSWGYGTDNGPDTWGSIPGYEVCGDGAIQSPIDLVRDESLGKTDKVDQEIIFGESFSTEDAEGEFFNNGHTVEFEVDQPNSYWFTGGPFGEEEYQFLQLHFHWGSIDSQGSEHTINGKRFPMEMHMVCINSKYILSDGSLDDAYATNADGVAVLGFMFKIGEQGHPPLTSITEGLSSLVNGIDTYINDDGYDTVPLQLNLGALVEPVIKRGYFTYSGSFTTPGCNEVVTWVNFKKPIEISEEQLEVYRSTGIADNFRPIQDLNGRVIMRGRKIGIQKNM